MLEATQARSQEPTVHISFQPHVYRCLPGSSKVDIVGYAHQRMQQILYLRAFPEGCH